MLISITGNFETQRLFNAMATRLESEVIVPELDNWSSDIYEGFLRREHVLSGRMKANTTKITPSQTRREVHVNTDYAEFENRRPGDKNGSPHRFVEPTLEEQNPKHFDALVNKITRFIEKN